MNNWNIEEITGYKPKTTLYTDFTIAEIFGTGAIKETYNKVFKEYKNDYIILTEFVMVLNWKIWEHYKTNKNLAKVYNDLWKKLDNYAVTNLKDNELQYFYKTTD